MYCQEVYLGEMLKQRKVNGTNGTSALRATQTECMEYGYLVSVRTKHLTKLHNIKGKLAQVNDQIKDLLSGVCVEANNCSLSNWQHQVFAFHQHACSCPSMFSYFLYTDSVYRFSLPLSLSGCKPPNKIPQMTIVAFWGYN